MNNLDYLDHAVTSVERDLGVQLIVTETIQNDFVEEPVAYNGDRTFYASKPIMNITANATGFVWHHPHGAVIRGNFAKPVEVARAIVDEYGDEMDFHQDEAVIAKAIVSKVGNIACLDEALTQVAGA